MTMTPYQQIIKELSDRIVKAQQPIRVLDSIKWGADIREEFFKNKFKKLPDITADYYQKNALPFDPSLKKEEFYEIESDVRRKLGQFNSVGYIMQRMCREYRELVSMITARGQPVFSKVSQELYGSSQDAFFAGEPALKDLADMISSTLNNIKNFTNSEHDQKCYTSEQAVEILQERMNVYFKTAERPVRVILSDGIISDSAAGSDVIKIREGAFFSQRDLQVLEVHEGWVHIATTLNGLEQPYCTFLSKGPPSSTFTQEGLAIIMEIFTFASYPGRVSRLTNRVKAINMAENGANFIEVFNFYREQALSEDESYGNTLRIFRGSTPEAGPFTKDLVYSKGFILVYNYIQLSIQRGTPSHIPLLFTGKTTLEDLRAIAGLIEEGIIVAPKFVPPQFKDLAALAAWMCYSSFLNRLNLERVATDLKDVL